MSPTKQGRAPPIQTDSTRRITMWTKSLLLSLALAASATPAHADEPSRFPITIGHHSDAGNSLLARGRHAWWTIVAVHEAGRWSDGRPFYAMQLVEGRSLAEELAARGRSRCRARSAARGDRSRPRCRGWPIATSGR
jgi:hypothetical protein